MNKTAFIFLLIAIALKGASQNTLTLVKLPENQRIDSLRDWGRKKLIKAKPDSAEYYFRLGLDLAKKMNNKTRIVQLYTDLANVNTLKRKPNDALVELNNARTYVTKETHKSTLARYYFYNGYVYRLLNKTDTAFSFFNKTEYIYADIDPYKNWEVYHSIGQLFYYNDNPEKAEEYFIKAYKITATEKKRMDHGLVLNALGNVYSRLKKPEKYASILKEYDELIGDRRNTLSKDPVHGFLFTAWKKIPEEEQMAFLLEMKSTHIKNKFFQGAVLANFYLAELFTKTNKPEKAIECLTENRDRLIGPESYLSHFDNLKMLYNLYTETGKHEEAIKTANQLFTLNNKITDITNKELTLNLEKKYETEKKEKEILLLNSQNELAALELTRQTEIRTALERENILKDSAISQQQALAKISEREKNLQSSELEKAKQLSNSLSRENLLKQQLIADDKKRNRILKWAFGLIVLASAIIFLQYRKQISKNKIIGKQREDLEILNREIHHRVKNNLQVISSLLELQSETAADKHTAEKFQEGSQRVQSMAYIHQNLYQGDTVESIDVKKYVEMLTSNLMQSYNASASGIKLDTDVEALRLHSETVIPLGMIINELVSNSLKYAFKNKERGEIKVVLKKINEKLLLQVKDDGTGIPDYVDITKTNSFGYKIIKAFTQKLKALMTIDSKSGTDVQLLIAKYRTA
ncbi:MAG: sensor histidine kinase [Chitinophagaceae bacterium]|nr:sensor histidine kinase [Chitinophagaceae bacterium]